MFLDVIAEWVFHGIGRATWWCFEKLGLAKSDLGDGGCVALGLVSSIFVGISLFLIWGFIYVD